ncbi:alpha-2-macroglobulin [Dysgonomonas sp. 511]|uniref:alpha-2-macroglobulin family protein n=1 Tax=Dysgonomonas sp. 511 TaxID=2302930 RepID=UPI0013D7FEB9|nr:alpha-2-macroglobulin family protein [Dysgonomonas sp. 511]NDV77416.1 hypothetical protein [Dysgonomonas sp. 511]
MKKHFLIGLLFLISIAMTAQTSNNKYEKDWEEVNRFQNESLPKSAVDKVDEILRKAIDEKNSTQVIKALIIKNKYKGDIDKDSDSLIPDIEALVGQTGKAEEKALLNSMLAELYNNYYDQHRWQIRRRTALTDVVPEDMKEWTSNIFINKIVENLNLSVGQAATLKKHTTKEFDDIIDLGVDKDKYPTLYDFLMKRAIEIAQQVVSYDYSNFDPEQTGATVEQLVSFADEYTTLNLKAGEDNRYTVFIYYQQYLKDLNQRRMTPTIALTEMDKINFVASNSYSFDGKSAHDAYIRLEKKYENNEISTEIIDKIVNSYNWGEMPVEIAKEQYEWIQKGLKKHPDSYGARLLKKSLAVIETPFLQVQGREIISPKNDFNITIEHKNLQAASKSPVLSLYKKEGNKYTLLKEYNDLNLISKTTYFADTIKLDLGKLPVGEYCFTSLPAEAINKLVNNKKAKYTQDAQSRFNFVVTNLISFSRNSKENEYEIFVTDRLSGKPMKDVTVKVVPEKYKDTDTDIAPVFLKTNAMGIATYLDKTVKKKGTYRWTVAKYTIALGADSCLEAQGLQENSYRWNNAPQYEGENLVINVFTDRTIYRPGQTLYFKAVAVDKNSNVIAGKSYPVELYNVNGEKVAEKTLITNEFGSVSGEFIIPQSGLLGQYNVAVNGGYRAYVNVEEYKRPTFEITFDKIDKSYSFGDEVTLKGYAKNFSGVSLQDTNVEYAITRAQFSFWRWGGGSYKAPFRQGTAKTKEDGSFEIIFTPLAGDNKAVLPLHDRQVYTFEVTAAVTDMNGETQSNTYSITVGNVSMAISLDMPDQMEKSSDYKLAITAKNLQGENIDTKGSFTIYSLDTNNSIVKSVKEGTFETGEQSQLKSVMKTLASGKYRLKVKALDNKGIEVDSEKDFVLFSYSDKKPPVKTDGWLVEKNTTFTDKGKPAEVIFGVTEKDVYVLYQLFNNNNVFERRFIPMSDANRTFTIPYKAEYGDGVNISFAYVKNGKMYQNDVSLKKEEAEPDTKLNVKLEVFRDKLRPGQAETWTLSVRDTLNNAAMAEVLASMYDISLDKLMPYTAWGFNRPHINKVGVYPMNFNFPSNYYADNDMVRSFFVQMKELDKEAATPAAVQLRFDQLNWFGYIPNYKLLKREGYVGGGSGGIAYAVPTVEEPIIPTEIMADSAPGFNLSLSKARVKSAPMPHYIPDESVRVGKLDPAAEAESGNTPQIRQNFAETAFFFPQLKTNEKGETQISFTVPESNTTWRFRALAHDKKSRVGTVEQFIVTQKELMVTPNMPRFIRQGDKTSISTKISNLSENAISGNVSIEFFDPATEKVIDLNIANKSQSFSVEKEASASAAWIFDVPSDMELIGCRIVAQNATFSDGEQHVLAVLPNRMLVTETLPMDITKEGTNTFTLDKLYNNNSATASNYKLTLEYTSNPAWYAVMALPTMSNPTNENAVNWFASYYVNTLGSSIVRQYPKVSAMIEAWKKQGGDKQTLMSNLQKDEELKNVLLEETPWVMDAKNETEQMQRLSLLFDLNNTKQQTDAATRKLSELMDNEGGWSWYKGMYPSRAISQYILYGYARLQQIGQVQYPEEIKRMQMQALKYIDKQIRDDFSRLKENNKDWEKTTSVSVSQLEFAYVRSFYRDIPIDQETRAAERFYTNVASKNWTKLGMYERSILVPVLIRNGEKALAGKILKSVREHAVNDKKLGMYWPNNRSNVFMSLSAISTHTFLMEALQEAGAKPEEMNALKRWLVNQKKTQQWESTHATIDAVSALLSTGSDWFSGETTPARVVVGGKAVEQQNKELGTGYIKQTWDKGEISKEMGKVEITTVNPQPAYGALYWQYYENLDKITAQKGDLSVEKQLYKENVTAAGNGLVQITESNPLTVGDKIIVRLTVRTNKDMDFVQLKDMRASCFEPLQTVSGVKWADGLIYYQMPKDASTNFYFDHLPKGTYVLEYPVYVNRTGEYTNGITTIQCMYAPEYASHTQGVKVVVK